MTRFALRLNSYVMKRVSASLWGVTASRTVPLDKTSCIVENKRRVRVFRDQFLWHHFPALTYQKCLAREQLLPILFLFSVIWQMFFFRWKKYHWKGVTCWCKKFKNQIYQLKIHSLKCFVFVWIQIRIKTYMYFLNIKMFIQISF